MRRTSAGIAALVLAVATAGSALLGGTALAGVPSQADISVQGTETNNCYTIKNGKIVKDNSSCSASAKGSNGSGAAGAAASRARK